MLDYKDLGKRLKPFQVNSQKTKSREDELIIGMVMQNGQRASRGYSWYHFRKLSGAAVAGQVFCFQQHHSELVFPLCWYPGANKGHSLPSFLCGRAGTAQLSSGRK